MIHTNGTGALKYPDELVNETGIEMSEQQKPEGYENWLTTTEAAKRLNVNSPQAVIGLIRRRRIIGVKLGTTFRGMWLINPDSIEAYLKGKK